MVHKHYSENHLVFTRIDLLLTGIMVSFAYKLALQPNIL